MSIFGNARDILASSLFCERVDYARHGCTPLVSLPAKVGRCREQSADRSGLTVVANIRDFILRREDMRLMFPPELRDTVAHAGRTYIVTSPQPGTPPWSWHDPENRTVRIHTKEINAND